MYTMPTDYYRKNAYRHYSTLTGKHLTPNLMLSV